MPVQDGRDLAVAAHGLDVASTLGTGNRGESQICHEARTLTCQAGPASPANETGVPEASSSAATRAATDAARVTAR